MRSLIPLLFVLSTTTLHAQNFSIKGDVRSGNNEGVPFAAIVLSLASDSSMYKAATTNMNGGFNIPEVVPGEYFVMVSSVGFAALHTDPFLVGNANVDLGTISLEQSSVKLKAAVVEAERAIIEVQPDKTVFNVKNVGSTAGLTGFELLRRSPGVVIDNNNGIILEGKSGVQVWFDGKPSVLSGEDLTQYLRSLQASDIESIELITQPSAKYDAEGTAGIINIKLKKNKSYGTNGSLSAGLAYWDYLKSNNSISLNNRNRKTNLFFTYSNRIAENLSWMSFDQRILDQLYKERSETVRSEKSHHIKAGADLFVSSKSTLGVVFGGSYNDAGSRNDSRTQILALSSDATPAQLRAESRDEALNKSQFVNTNYRFEDTLGHSLNVDMDVYHYGSDRVSDQPNEYFDESGMQLQEEFVYQMRTPVDILLLSGKIDYEQNLGKGKLGFGTKATLVRTENSFSFFEADNTGVLQFVSANSNDFNYDERVFAVYSNYQQKFKKWSYQLGVRMENTYSLGELVAEQETDNDEVERNYTNLFPSGGVSYQPNQNHSWALNYSRRINRPNYEELNPFEFRLNELSFRQGNPFLRPNYSDNIKLSNTYKYRFTTALSYTRVSDFYAQVTDTLTDGGTFGGFTPSIIQARNVAIEEVLSLNVSLPFDVNDWWSVYVNINAYRTSYTSEDPKFNAIAINAVGLFGQNTFKLDDKLRLEVSGWVNNGSIWGGTFVTEGQGSLDIALNRKFVQDRLNVSLSLSDIFYTAPWRAIGEFNGLPIAGNGGWESRLLRINLNYNFGNQEVKKRKDRKTATEEEQQRL